MFKRVLTRDQLIIFLYFIKAVDINQMQIKFGSARGTVRKTLLAITNFLHIKVVFSKHKPPRKP
jgi:hypothetical protein